ncbi:hypothetical protein U7230_15105 [Carboxydochorda subterranea]|uniref:Uncharacterized protein n=1 Tax=Carboxydichorda subterranea TaxID=3109565 RepID=A0ABZ1BXW0_9FIRM|nr:hypothetical protein [Limnochorda sp. L945t]WRP17386.1 hypothetical protein U7230_15105 [Limnochorda sp. L945t]
MRRSCGCSVATRQQEPQPAQDDGGSIPVTMGRTARELTEQEKAAYRHAWLSLRESRQAEARQAAKQAMAVAREAAAILHGE